MESWLVQVSGKGLKVHCRTVTLSLLQGQEEAMTTPTPFYTTECVGGAPPSWDEPRVKPLNSMCWEPLLSEARGPPARAKSPGSNNKLLGPEPHSRGRGSGSSEAGLHCSPSSWGLPERKSRFSTSQYCLASHPIHLYGFPVTCPSTVMSWYRVTNLHGKDPKSPRALCTAGACLVYLLRCVWLLRAYGV